VVEPTVIVVFVAVAVRAVQLSAPTRPYRTLPEVAEVVVAQLTVTFVVTRSVRYGYRRRVEDRLAVAVSEGVTATRHAKMADTATMRFATFNLLSSAGSRARRYALRDNFARRLAADPPGC
jgi:hypothetical protein